MSEETDISIPSAGPWHAIEFAGNFLLLDEPYYEGTDLLNRDYYNNAEINAHLASKAPQMLDVLEFAKQAFSQYQNIHGTEKCEAWFRIDAMIQEAKTINQD